MDDGRDIFGSQCLMYQKTSNGDNGLLLVAVVMIEVVAAGKNNGCPTRKGVRAGDKGCRCHVQGGEDGAMR